jgi:hypothetical protein
LKGDNRTNATTASGHPPCDREVRAGRWIVPAAKRLTAARSREQAQASTQPKAHGCAFGSMAFAANARGGVVCSPA